MSVHIAIPAYGGQVYGAFAASLLDLERQLKARRIDFDIQWMWNESMVCRARNACASQFYKGKRECLQFLDADLEFSGNAVAEQLSACLQGGPQLVGGSYPSKRYHPAAINAAVGNGFRGSALLAASLRLVTNLDGTEVASGGASQETPVEAWYLNGTCYVKARYLPTGLLTIHRAVLDAVLAGPEGPSLPYVTADNSQQWDFFLPSKVEIEGKLIRLSEDYAFSARAAAVGITPWWNVDNTAVHWGTHRYVPHGLHSDA